MHTRLTPDREDINEDDRQETSLCLAAKILDAGGDFEGRSQHDQNLPPVSSGIPIRYAGPDGRGRGPAHPHSHGGGKAEK